MSYFPNTTILSSLTSVGNISTGTWNASTLTVTVNSIINTSTDGLALVNSTSATVSVQQQYSPRIRLAGQGWAGFTGNTSYASWIIENQPQNIVAGSAGGNLVFSFAANTSGSPGGSYSAVFTLTQLGVLTISGSIIPTVLNIGTTTTDGVALVNSTASTNTVPQWSPRLRLAGQGWAGFSSASTYVSWIIENQTSVASGGTNAFGNLTFSVTNPSSSSPSNSYSPILNITALGVMTLNNSGASSLITTSTDGLVIINQATASAGTISRWSPRLRLTGYGWKSNSTAASQEVDFILENQAAGGSASATGNLVISSQINGAGYTIIHTITNTGNLIMAGTLQTTSAVAYDFGAVSSVSATALITLNLTKQLLITVSGTQYFVPCATSVQ